MVADGVKLPADHNKRMVFYQRHGLFVQFLINNSVIWFLKKIIIIIV